MNHPYRLTVANNLRKTQAASENIRERLNLHVKRRIEVQEKTNRRVASVLSQSSSSPSSPASISPPIYPANLTTNKNERFLSPSLNTHPVSNASVANERLDAPAYDYVRTKTLKRVKITKKVPVKISAMNNKKKFASVNRSKYNHEVDQPLHRIKSNDGDTVKATKVNHDESLVRSPTIGSNKVTSYGSPPMADAKVPTVANHSIYEKCDSKATSMPDILSMVLNEKKNALMRDPDIIRFFTGIQTH